MDAKKYLIDAFTLPYVNQLPNEYLHCSQGNAKWLKHNIPQLVSERHSLEVIKELREQCQQAGIDYGNL